MAKKFCTAGVSNPIPPIRGVAELEPGLSLSAVSLAESEVEVAAGTGERLPTGVGEEELQVPDRRVRRRPSEAEEQPRLSTRDGLRDGLCLYVWVLRVFVSLCLR